MGVANGYEETKEEKEKMIFSVSLDEIKGNGKENKGGNKQTEREKKEKLDIIFLRNKKNKQL